MENVLSGGGVSRQIIKTNGNPTNHKSQTLPEASSRDAPPATGGESAQTNGKRALSFWSHDIVMTPEIVESVSATRQRLALLELRILQAGIIDVQDDPRFGVLLGHRLDQAELAINEVGGELDTVLLPMDAAWVLSCATLVFLMQLGFAQLEAGICRPKNVIVTYVKNIADFVLGSLATLLVGYAIAYGQTPLVDEIQAWKFFFHLVFQATASTIVSGAMAERMRMAGYAIVTTFLSGIVYAICVNITWGGGFLYKMDPPFHDFAGAGVVHLLGGSAALAGCLVLGSRHSRWEVPEKFTTCHSVPQVLSGALLLWIGWYGFNPGSTGAMSSTSDGYLASNAAMTTTISGATAACAALLYDLVSSRGEHMDVVHFVNSLLGGLVSITAGSDILGPWTAMATGTIAYLVFSASKRLVVYMEIDDVVDAISVHGACGAWGCLAVGLFHPENGALMGDSPELVVAQLYGIGTICLLGFVPMYVICRWLHAYGLLRAHPEEEAMGIDWHLFQLTAYVDNEVFADESNIFTDDVANEAHDNPAIQKLANSLRQQLNMPKDATLRTVIEKAAAEFEVSPEATTLYAKAQACWKVLREGRIENDASKDVLLQQRLMLGPPQRPPAARRVPGPAMSERKDDSSISSGSEFDSISERVPPSFKGRA